MFRTELTIAPAARPLPRTARLLTLGSCFAESIGQRLTDNKVTTLVNPFGTTYQPLALARLLRAAAGDAVDWPQHIVEARGRWQTYDLPGRFGAHSPVELLQDIEEAVYHAGTFLRQADVVLLTLGTAWAYRLRETGELVNNCHKMPAELFERELLTADDIINALAETHAYLRRLNPKLRVVLTVSPVRHLRDTLPLNAVSKAVLRVACHYLSELLPDVTYFPAYELLTDDLRDYRFYGADMLHPSAVAEDYIWDKFAQTYFDADFAAFRREWGGLRQALAHRPLHEAAPEHRHFLTQTAERLGRLATLGHDVGHELAEVQTRIAALPEPRTLAAAPEPADDGQERIDIGPAQATAPAANLEYRDATGRTAALQALEDAADARTAALDEARQRAADRAAELAALAAESSTPQPSTPAQTNRPGRLSPEEFRQQRAEKGRGGRNNRRNERNAPVQPPATPAAQNAAETAASGSAIVPAQTPSKTPSLVAAPAVATPDAVVPPLPLAAEGGEIGKKKKRRSRGGAKRTARKNAARLAETDATDSTAPAATTPVVPVSPAKSSVIQKSEPNLRSQRQKRTNAPTAPAVPTAPVASVAPVPVAASTATVPSLAESVLGLKPKKVAGEYAGAVSVVAPAVVSPPAKANRRRPAPAPIPAATAAVAPAAAVAAVPVVPAPVVAAAPPKTAARKPKPSAATPAKAAPPVTPEAPAAAKQPAAAKTVASGAKPAKAAVKAAPAKVVAISAKKEPASSKQKVAPTRPEAAPAKPETAPAKAKTAAPKKAATPAKPKAAAATAVPKAAKAAPANATKPAAKKPSK